LSSTVEVLERALKSDSDVWHGVRHNFIQSSQGRAEVTAFNLSSLGVNDFTEGVLFQEELLEDIIAILFVQVASTSDSIRSDWS